MFFFFFPSSFHRFSFRISLTFEDLLHGFYGFMQSMVLVNQAIFEAKDGYSKKVKVLEGRLTKDDLDLEKMTTELEKLLTNMDHNRVSIIIQLKRILVWKRSAMKSSWKKSRSLQKG